MFAATFVDTEDGPLAVIHFQGVEIWRGTTPHQHPNDATTEALQHLEDTMRGLFNV